MKKELRRAGVRVLSVTQELTEDQWENESDENVIESVALTFDLFELIQ